MTQKRHGHSTSAPRACGTPALTSIAPVAIPLNPRRNSPAARVPPVSGRLRNFTLFKPTPARHHRPRSPNRNAPAAIQPLTADTGSRRPSSCLMSGTSPGTAEASPAHPHPPTPNHDEPRRSPPTPLPPEPLPAEPPRPVPPTAEPPLAEPSGVELSAAGLAGNGRGVAPGRTTEAPPSPAGPAAFGTGLEIAPGAAAGASSSVTKPARSTGRDCRAGSSAGRGNHSPFAGAWADCTSGRAFEGVRLLG